MGCEASREGMPSPAGQAPPPFQGTPEGGVTGGGGGTPEEYDPYIMAYVLEKWKLADRDNSGRLSFNEILKLLNSLNITLKESVVKEKFKSVDKDGSKELDFNEFRNFLAELCTRPELKELFLRYTKNAQYLTPEEFVLFLQQEQYELNADIASAMVLIKKFEHSQDATRLFFTGFTEYMVSKENSAFNSEHTRAVYHDMTFPLTHYFMSSSHNTYLEGHQLKGIASVDAYSAALLQGCRCVELDCWNGDDGNPIIHHGHTIVTKVRFRDVIQGIKEFGFKASPYPIVLSLENHCTVDQQLKMAEIMKEILGDMIPPSFVLNKVNPLPSPDQLKYKVLLKGKMMAESAMDRMYAEEDYEEEPEPEEDEDEEDEDDDDGASSKSGGSKKGKEKEKEKEKEKDKKKKEKGTEVKKEPKIKLPVAKELSDMVHLKGSHFPGFTAAKERNAPWEISSLSELTVKKYTKANLQGCLEYTLNQIGRVYPKGTRFDSSNFDPMPSWTAGFQAVALNVQTKDIWMRLNLGKFLDNGQCGYTLKPDSQRFLDKSYRDEVRKTLQVKVISAWQLPKESGTTKGEVIDPYIKVKSFGFPEDTKKFRTKVVANNGFNPQWDETFTFDLARSDVALLLLEIWDQDKISSDDFIGFACIPLSSVKQGFRTVHLFDKKSNALPDSSLFVQLTFA